MSILAISNLITVDIKKLWRIIPSKLFLEVNIIEKVYVAVTNLYWFS